MKLFLAYFFSFHSFYVFKYKQRKEGDVYLLPTYPHLSWSEDGRNKTYSWNIIEENGSLGPLSALRYCWHRKVWEDLDLISLFLLAQSLYSSLTDSCTEILLEIQSQMQCCVAKVWCNSIDFNVIFTWDNIYKSFVVCYSKLLGKDDIAMFQKDSDPNWVSICSAVRVSNAWCCSKTKYCAIFKLRSYLFPSVSVG